MATNNQLRIIGGKWRGRKLVFPTVEGLRPTPDRVRETLFNWLQNDIIGKRCVDLFAGSGALGLEALSRGAKQVEFIEKDRSAALQLKSHLAMLDAESSSVIQADALQLIKQKCHTQYDVAFIDPPYNKNVTLECIEQLEINNWFSNQATLYFELPKHQTTLDLPNTWTITKAKTAGQVAYHLAKRNLQLNENPNLT